MAPAAVVVLALLASAAAFTAAGRKWSAPAPATVDGASSTAMERGPSWALRPLRVIQASTAAPPPTESAGTASEERLYGRAHRAHFADDAPARALPAWNEYLRAYPEGTFAPEARYNRALCLVRLGRLAEAAHALRPFARGAPGGYRREEARALLEWIADRR